MTVNLAVSDVVYHNGMIFFVHENLGTSADSCSVQPLRWPAVLLLLEATLDYAGGPAGLLVGNWALQRGAVGVSAGCLKNKAQQARKQVSRNINLWKYGNSA